MKAQNWFAVALDFLIVVVGVFIGMQVSNWNQERAERELDQLYITRLHDEVVKAQGSAKAVREELDATVKYLTEAVAIITDEAAPAQLTQFQCDAIFASHIYRPGRMLLPTLEELISSGRATILSDARLREAILTLSQRQQPTDDHAEAYNRNIPVLSRKYPDLIQLNRKMEYERFGFGNFSGHTCQVQLMRGNNAFLNDLIDNMYRIDGFLKIGLIPEFEQLEKVHVLLDDMLGVTH